MNKYVITYSKSSHTKIIHTIEIEAETREEAVNIFKSKSDGHFLSIYKVKES